LSIRNSYKHFAALPLSGHVPPKNCQRWGLKVSPFWKGETFLATCQRPPTGGLTAFKELKM
jgi:hypothetical protein